MIKCGPRTCSLEPAMSLYLDSMVEMIWLQMNVVNGPRPRKKAGSSGASTACKSDNYHVCVAVDE